MLEWDSRLFAVPAVGDFIMKPAPKPFRQSTPLLPDPRPTRACLPLKPRLPCSSPATVTDTQPDDGPLVAPPARSVVAPRQRSAARLQPHTSISRLPVPVLCRPRRPRPPCKVCSWTSCFCRCEGQGCFIF